MRIVELTPDKLVPFTFGTGDHKLDSIRTQIEIAAITEEAVLRSEGVSEDLISDVAEANELFTKIIESEAKGKGTPPPLPKLRTAVALRLREMLRQYDEQVVESSLQLRTYIVNKLIDETENNDGKIRIRALELLGKVQDVGLFVEKAEIKHTHVSDDEINSKLEAKLAKLLEERQLNSIPAQAVAVVEPEEEK